MEFKEEFEKLKHTILNHPERMVSGIATYIKLDESYICFEDFSNTIGRSERIVFCLKMSLPYRSGADSFITWHRLDGPAVIELHMDRYSYGFWIYDSFVSETDFNKHTLVIDKRVNRLIKEVLGD